MSTQPHPPLPLRVPDSLAELDQWVLWCRRNDTKIPYSAHTGKSASSTNRNDWVCLDEATAALAKHPKKYAGLGFVFAADDPYCGIDLDDCRDPKTGAIKPWAQQILQALDSYAEVSPSGEGVKIWAKASIPGSIKTHVDASGNPLPFLNRKPHPDADGAVEIYDSGRYFTFTGQPLSGPARDVEECQAGIDELYQRMRGPAATDDQPSAPSVIPEEVHTGSRHNTLMHTAASMRAQGLGEIEIMAALKVVNELRMKPPKPDQELAGIVEWICRKPAGTSMRLLLRPDPNDQQPADQQSAEPAQDGMHLPDLYDPSKPAPNDIAQAILETKQIVCNSGGMVWEYNGRWWEQVTKEDIASHAMRLDTHAATKKTRRVEAVNYVLDATRRKMIPWRQISDLEIPCWNGVVHIESCDIRSHRSTDFLEAVIPHEYDPSQRCYLWIAALRRWFRDDKDADAKVDAIQEYFGYCLLPHAKYKKALMLYGESDTGKSQVAHALRALVGSVNTCSLSTEQMADERKRAGIVGKMLNVLTELPADAMIADGGFKQLVANDEPVAIDPKYLAPFTYVPFCKHIIATNNLPAINDHTRATYNRLLLIKFNHVIPKREQDPSLKDKLLTEMPGILGWSIEGAFRLVQNRGEFTKIEESEDAITEYREQQNPIYSFIAEKCEEVEPASGADPILVSEFADKFSDWARKVYEVRKVIQLLKSAGKPVKKSKDRSHFRDKTCVYGLAWK